MKSRWSCLVVVGVAALSGLAGCADPKDKQISDLTQQRDQLQAELDDKNRQLAGLGQREGDALRTINDLRNRLREAEEKSQNLPRTEDGWVSLPGFDMISIPGEVLFDSGKATLRPTGRTALDRIVSDVRGRYVDRDIYVVGHTDNEPIKKSGWKDNWELGAQRALTVTRYLAANGVSEKNLIQAAAGEQRPRDSNASAAGKQKNRRVEFYAVVRRDLTRADTDSGNE